MSSFSTKKGGNIINSKIAIVFSCISHFNLFKIYLF